MAHTDQEREGLTPAAARAERDTVLAALAADDTWLDHAATRGLDTRQMALLDELGTLDTALTRERWSA